MVPNEYNLLDGSYITGTIRSIEKTADGEGFRVWLQDVEHFHKKRLLEKGEGFTLDVPTALVVTLPTTRKFRLEWISPCDLSLNVIIFQPGKRKG